MKVYGQIKSCINYVQHTILLVTVQVYVKIQRQQVSILGRGDIIRLQMMSNLPLADADKGLGSLWHCLQSLRVHVQDPQGTCIRITALFLDEISHIT